jgi:hypothetical protein
MSPSMTVKTQSWIGWPSQGESTPSSDEDDDEDDDRGHDSPCPSIIEVAQR